MMFRMLKRSWASGESRLLAFALILAVLVLATISIFTARLENTLLRQSNAMLGADFIVESPASNVFDYAQDATLANVPHAQAVLFSSMAYAEEHMQLVSIKAVNNHYPLRGEFEVSQIAFALDKHLIESVVDIPASGEVWVDSRILPLLNIELGDSLGIGEADFKVTKILIREPDSTSFFSLMGGPRVLMNLQDLAATQVVQPGSRVTYQALFASDDETRLQVFRQQIDAKKTLHERVKDLQTAENRVSRSLDTGRQFLIIAAVMTVLLAGVAIAIAARRFAENNVHTVALFKSLGASTSHIRHLYLAQFLLLGFIASLIGLLLGDALQRLIAWGIREYFSIALVAPNVWPYVYSLLGGILCLLAFAMPALWHLPRISPLRILRNDVPINRARILSQILVAAASVVVLIGLFSQDLRLAVIMTVGVSVVVFFTLLLSWGGLSLVRKGAMHLGGIWRIAFANLHRRQGQSAIMILVFAIALMLLLTLTLLRTSLIEEWKMQVPENAPNHFLVNIPENEVASVQDKLDSQQLIRETIYPMVRGRLIEINHEAPSEEQRRASNSLHRELNLTWSEILADDNKIVEGYWFGDANLVRQTSFPGVSVEQEDASRIGIKLGDVLTFSIGGIETKTEVLSIRSLDWRSMRPNFFYILEPGSLELASPTFITSFYLPPEQKSFINDLLKVHPTLMVVELDRVINQIQTIITQVSYGVLLVFILTLCGGILVLFAAVLSSLDSRKREIGLLRAMGASKSVVTKSLGVEFAVLGAIAGALAIIGCEALVFLVQRYILENPVQPHYLFWVAAPCLGAILIASLGYFSLKPLVSTAPAQVLRDAQ